MPENAKVYVNGVRTSSTGSERSYVSRGLQQGFNYTYEVRAEIERDGETVEETKTVSMRAGSANRLAFDLPSVPQTSLTLNVPAEAKVFLAGSETKSSGPVREFTTTKLATGESWDNYTILVTLNGPDAEPRSQEKTIVLKSGDTQELSFDFETPQVAAAR